MNFNPRWHARSEQGNRIKKSEVILNEASARAKAAGRCAVKDPVECLNDVRSCLDTFSEVTGSFDSAPPRLCPRGAPLRMTAILMRLSWLSRHLFYSDDKRAPSARSNCLRTASCTSSTVIERMHNFFCSTHLVSLHPQQGVRCQRTV